MSVKNTQSNIDAFYAHNGPCCAGCDWWRWYNSVVGECAKSAPVSGADKIAMLGVHGLSMPIGAGHVMTIRSHVCGDFKDDEARKQ